MTERRVLIVSLNFPPSTIASVHRARHLAKALPSHGWQPRILTVDERFHKESPEPALARLVPSDVEVVRTPAIPVGVARAFGLGDLSIRAMPFLRRELLNQIRTFAPNVVFMTGWPFYQMLLARRVKRMGVPVVLDFQDPWVSRVGATRSALSKAGLSHRLATIIEPLAIRHADFITSVSEGQNAELAARYPFLDPARMAAIPIGGDPDDFVALRRDPPKTYIHRLDPAFLNISYIGAFLPRAEATVQTILAALSRLRASEPTTAARIRLNFVGTSNQPRALGTGPIAPLAQAAGVADLVTETAQRVPFLEALALNANSTGILMIGSDEPHYTASKIFSGLLSGRPYLSLFHRASSAHQILTAAGGGVTFSFADPIELIDLERPIAEALARLAKDPASFGVADSASYAQYTADGVAAAYAAVFDRVVATRSGKL